MENQKEGLNWKVNLLLAIILSVVAIVIRLPILSHPAEIIFDEFYYVDAAQQILGGKPDPNWVHPPVGKYLIGSGILLFGDNPVGWRIVGVLFGGFSVFVLFYLGLELFRNTTSALIAGFLLTIDPLHFVQTRIAMLDALFLPFVLIGFYGVLRHFRSSRLEDENPKSYSHWLLVAGISIGAGLTIKWTAALVIPGVIAIYVVYTLRRRDKQFIVRSLGAWSRRASLMGLLFIVMPVAIFLSGYTLDFIRGTTFEEWLAIQFSIIDFQTTVRSEHPYSSPAWTWVLSLKPMLYYLDESADAIIRLEGNNIAWLFGLVGVGYVAYRAVRGGRIAAFVLITFAIQYLPWFLSPRTTYLFYFFPSVPFFHLASTYLLTVFMTYNYKREGLIVTLVFLTGVLGLFVYAFPTYVGIPQTFWSTLISGVD